MDCLKFEARLPQEKVDKCIDSVEKAPGRNKITLGDLQSLIGSLNFACSVVVPSRVFLRGIINLTIGKKHPHHFIRIKKEVKQDLHIWEMFSQSFSGKSFFLEEVSTTSGQLRFYTDAAKFKGCVWHSPWEPLGIL